MAFFARSLELCSNRRAFLNILQGVENSSRKGFQRSAKKAFTNLLIMILIPVFGFWVIPKNLQLKMEDRH